MKGQEIQDPIVVQNYLRDLMPPGDSVDHLVEDWKSQFSEAIDEIAPQRSLPIQTSSLVYTGAAETEKEAEMARVSLAENS